MAEALSGPPRSGVASWPWMAWGAGDGGREGCVCVRARVRTLSARDSQVPVAGRLSTMPHQALQNQARTGQASSSQAS